MVYKKLKEVINMKRIISTLLMLLLVLSMFSAFALAEEDNTVVEDTTEPEVEQVDSIDETEQDELTKLREIVNERDEFTKGMKENEDRLEKVIAQAREAIAALNKAKKKK